MSNDILRSVFSDESLDLATFEKRLATKGGFHIVSDEAFSALNGLSQRNSELESELAAVKDEGKIELLLSQTRVKNIKAARAMLDESSFYDENGLNDGLLLEQTEKLKDENPWLFEDNAPQVKTVSTVLPRGRALTKDTSRMSDEEFYKNILKNEK